MQLFSMLHCNFSLVAAQLLVEVTSALEKSQCCSATFAAQHIFQGEFIYTPPPPPPFLAKRHFPGEGGGGVYFEGPTRQEFYTPPPLLPFTPHPLGGYFQGWWGWGCIKFGPLSIPKTAAQLPFSLVACCRGGV